MHPSAKEYGWDVSCAMNAQLCKKEQLVYENGRVIEIKGEQ